MKANNDHCKDAEIDYQVLSNLPTNGLTFDSLRTYTNEDNDDFEDNEADEGGLEPGPAQGATGPCPNEENIHVTESFACANPSHSDEINQDKIVNVNLSGD